MRKPDFSRSEYKQFLDCIPNKYKQYTIVHHHHEIIKDYPTIGIHHTSKTEWNDIFSNNTHQSKSCHSLAEVKNNRYPYNYLFLSPIFNSISKPGYPGKFDFNELKTFLKNLKNKTEIIALGGIEPKNIATAIAMGFNGVAILGTIWQETELKKRIEKFQTISTKLKIE